MTTPRYMLGKLPATRHDGDGRGIDLAALKADLDQVSA